MILAALKGEMSCQPRESRPYYEIWSSRRLRFEDIRSVSRATMKIDPKRNTS